MEPIERDFYEERRRRWRRRSFWKGFFVALILGAILFSGALFEGVRGLTDQVARVEIDGIITEDLDLEAMLDEIAERDNVRALVVRINSPGGTTAGSEALFGALRRVGEAKPVAAVLGEVAASGGYIAAMAADHIVARGNSLTGSIGVIMEYPDVTALLDRFGIDVETFRSSELKAEPAPYRPITPEARRLSEALVEESYRWFRDLVAERRGLEGEALDRVANGAVFTGRIAHEAGLVDALGGEREAIAWLESREAGLEALPVRDWALDPDESLAAQLIGFLVPSGGIFGEIGRFAGPKLYSLGP